jgi:dipeptidyl aminopeptidase/acylaminoacyl peptidase
MLGTTDIASFSRFNMGGTLWERRDEYAKRSPLTYVPNIQTPVLIQHWEGDLRCPIGQSEQLFCGLRLLGKEVEFVRYPGGAHISRSPAQGVDRVKRILAWYERVRS